MKRIYIGGVALLALASMPLIAQKTTKVRRVSAPEVAVFETSSGRSYLGVGINDLSSDRIQALKLKDDRGVEVTQVDQDAPAGKAGLKEKDVIIAFNGTPVESAEQFKRLMRETPPGRTVSLDIVRDGQQQNVKVQVADRKKLESQMWPHDQKEFAMEMPAIPPMPPTPEFPRMFPDRTIVRVRASSGATLESLSPQLGDFFGVKNGEGLLVRSVQKGTPADAAGLRAGDVIVRVGDQKVTDNADWTEALRNSKTGKVALVIVREKREQTLSMTVPLRKGPDSSAVNQDASPVVEQAMDSAATIIEDAEPLVEQSIDVGLDSAIDGLGSNCDRIADEIKRAMDELHRELINNRGEINREIAQAMRSASTELRSHRTEIDKAMRDAQRAIQNIHVELGSEMQ